MYIFILVAASATQYMGQPVCLLAGHCSIDGSISLQNLSELHWVQ